MAFSGIGVITIVADAHQIDTHVRAALVPWHDMVFFGCLNADFTVSGAAGRSILIDADAAGLPMQYFLKAKRAPFRLLALVHPLGVGIGYFKRNERDRSIAPGLFAPLAAKKQKPFDAPHHTAIMLLA